MVFILVSKRVAIVVAFLIFRGMRARGDEPEPGVPVVDGVPEPVHAVDDANNLVICEGVDDGIGPVGIPAHIVVPA